MKSYGLQADPEISMVALDEEDGARTFVTHGLAEVGQAELLWSFAPEVEIKDIVPAQLFKFVVEHAAEGGKTGAGCVTRLGQGMLGRDDFVGIGYGPGHDPGAAAGILEGRPYLRMLFLTEAELDVADRYGLARVLTCIGAKERFFPFPSRDNNKRQPALDASHLDVSKIDQINRVGIDDARSFLEGEFATLRLPAAVAAETVDALLEHEGGMISTPVSSAIALDAFAWTAAGAPAAITGRPNPGGQLDVENRRVAGNFAMVGVNDDGQQGAAIYEDGFILQVARENWEPALTRLRAGYPAVLRPREGSPYGVVICTDAGPDADQHAHLEGIALVTPETEMSQHVVPDQISTFIEFLLLSCGAALSQEKGALGVRVELSSGAPVLSFATEIPDELLNQVVKLVHHGPSPRPAKPVVFDAKIMLGAG